MDLREQTTGVDAKLERFTPNKTIWFNLLINELVDN